MIAAAGGEADRQNQARRHPVLKQPQGNNCVWGLALVAAQKGYKLIIVLCRTK